jgi:hypothetical protein
MRYFMRLFSIFLFLPKIELARAIQFRGAMMLLLTGGALASGSTISTLQRTTSDYDRSQGSRRGL